MKSQEESKTNMGEEFLMEKTSPTTSTELSRELTHQENTEEIGNKLLKALQKGYLERQAERQKK